MGTKAVAPTKGGKEVTAKIVKEKPAKEKPEKKILVSKKKKLGVDKKNKQDNKKKKVIVSKKKEPPAKKKKIIPKVSDPSLELTWKLVQQEKKGNALNLKKRKEKEFRLAPSVAQKLKKKKQVLSKEQLKRREEKVEVDTTQLQTLLPSLPSLPAFGGGKKVVVVKSESGGEDKKIVDYSAVINPLILSFRVVNSDKGQEAVPVLIDGGLKLLSAILEEGKQSKVEISQGYDRGTGNLKKKKVVNIGLKQLLDGALFAGGEFLPTIKQTYDKLYVGGEGEKTKITRIAAKVDKKTGKVLKPTEETYFVTIGGTRQRVIKKV